MALIRIHKYDAFENSDGRVWILTEKGESKCKLLFVRDLNEGLEMPLDVLRQMIKTGALKRVS